MKLKSKCLNPWDNTWFGISTGSGSNMQSIDHKIDQNKFRLTTTTGQSSDSSLKTESESEDNDNDGCKVGTTTITNATHSTNTVKKTP